MSSIPGQWLSSLKHYVLMCLLMSSPARLPPGHWPVAITVVAYFIVAIPLASEAYPYPALAGQILLELALLGGLAWLGLRWRDKTARFMQTLSAMIGINVVITAATFPVYRALEDGETNLAIIFVALIWNLAALSLVIKRALEISTPLAALITFNYFVLFQLIVFGAS